MIPMFRPTVIPHVEVLNLTTPVYAQFELTGKCNYRCIMCYNAWKGDQLHIGRQLNREEHFRILDILNPHIFSLVFSGGEPTLISWLPGLVEYTRQANVDCSIITNGSNITPTLAHDLDVAGLQNAQISLHHFTGSINDWITGVEGSCGATLQGAHNLMKTLGAESLGVCMVTNNQTYADVYEMGRFLHKEGFKSLAVGVMSFSGMAARNRMFLTVSQLRSVIRQLEQLHAELGFSVGLTGGVPHCVLGDGYEDSPVEVYNHCDAAINQIVVGPDGEARPCVEYPQSGGNLLEVPLTEIWQSPVFRKVRNFEDVPPSCHDCVLVSSCRGGCRVSALNYTGQLQGQDPLTMEENQ
jgi:radical SAM protein with 4Fe4S-binding SPASM domain